MGPGNGRGQPIHRRGDEELRRRPDNRTSPVRPSALAHPTVGVTEQDEDGYQVTIDYENGVQLVRSLGDAVQSPAEDGDS